MAKYFEHFAETDRFFTKGQRYKAVREEIDEDLDDCYVFIDDEGAEHHMNKSPDENGIYVGTWFREVVVTERGIFRRVMAGLITGVAAIGLSMAMSAGILLVTTLIFNADNSPWVRVMFAAFTIGVLARFIYVEVTETDEADGDETDY